jgi:hypothetical protein
MIDMFVIEDPSGLWVKETEDGIEWVDCPCGATQYETEEAAVAVCEANGICTCWVIAL